MADKRLAAVVRQAAGQLRLLASQVREARRQAETYVDWYMELKRDLRRAERQRAERVGEGGGRGVQAKCAAGSPAGATTRPGAASTSSPLTRDWLLSAS